jgi:hypothetical protein
MIYAHFNYKNDQVMNYSLSGHAESGPYGHDLVCAAVSALTIGTANNLSRLAEIEPEIDANQEEGGFIEIVLPSQMDKNQQETAQILLKALYYSLLDIQEEYQEYISVSKTNNE